MYGKHIHDIVFVLLSRGGKVLAGSVACDRIPDVSVTTVLRVGTTTFGDSNLSQTPTKFLEIDHIGITGESSLD